MEKQKLCEIVWCFISCVVVNKRGAECVNRIDTDSSLALCANRHAKLRRTLLSSLMRSCNACIDLNACTVHIAEIIRVSASRTSFIILIQLRYLICIFCYYLNNLLLFTYLIMKVNWFLLRRELIQIVFFSHPQIVTIYHRSHRVCVVLNFDTICATIRR